MTAGGAKTKVVGLGLACLDQLLLWQDAQKPVSGNRIVGHEWQGGGMVGTALTAVTRLGGSAEYWGALGDDWMADRILAGLAEERIDARHVVRVAGGRGPLVIVCVDQPTGERYFLYSAGFGESAEPLGAIEGLRDAGCLLVDGTQHASAVRAASEARRLGVPVVADIGWLRDRTAELLAHVDVVIASEGCARALKLADDLPAACDRIRSMGPKTAVFTLGSRGVAWLDDEGYGRRDAFPVEVVDTTGAGDTFHGAFCYGLIRGLPLENNLTFASAVAAMKCRRMGGRAGIPRLAEVVRFLSDRGFDWASERLEQEEETTA